LNQGWKNIDLLENVLGFWVFLSFSVQRTLKEDRTQQQHHHHHQFIEKHKQYNIKASIEM